MKREKTVPCLYSSPYECCGCSACFSVCPVNAIQMKEDEEGFQYPHIDRIICVGCGRCEQVCQLKSKTEYNEPISIFAARNKSAENRLSGSSGGIFSLLAGYMESQGSVIYGAAFDSDFSVVHKRAAEKGEWTQFCKSKYVQSITGNIYASVKNDLEKGKPVLFTGTPCQIEGLNRYLSETDTQKLLTCDVICHGVPSPKIWHDWLDEIRKKTGKNIGRINFRDKGKTGWHHSSLTVSNPEGDVLSSGTHSDNSYSKMYFQHLIVRPSCHKCPYAGFKRAADLTLGDFWGIEKEFPDFDDDKGTSLVLCNSQKGLAVWNEVQVSTDSFTVMKSQCAQPNLLHATAESKNRRLFWKLYHRYGLNKTMKIFKVVPLKGYEKAAIKILRVFMRIAGIM